MDGLEVRTQLSTKIKEQEENAKSEKRTVLEKWKVIDLGFALFNQAHPLRWYTCTLVGLFTSFLTLLELVQTFLTKAWFLGALIAKALHTKIMYRIFHFLC